MPNLLEEMREIMKKEDLEKAFSNALLEHAAVCSGVRNAKEQLAKLEARANVALDNVISIEAQLNELAKEEVKN